MGLRELLRKLLRRKPKQPEDWRGTILKLFPEGENPLMEAIKSLPKAKDPIFFWWDK